VQPGNDIIHERTNTQRSGGGVNMQDISCVLASVS